MPQARIETAPLALKAFPGGARKIMLRQTRGHSQSATGRIRRGEPGAASQDRLQRLKARFTPIAGQYPAKVLILNA